MEKNINHSLNIEERSILEITGVKDVTAYNEDELEIVTDFGTLTICGNDFNITKLDVETGELKITGKVDSLFYSEKSEKASGLLKRLFR